MNKLSIQDFRSSLTNKLLPQSEVDEFNRSYSMKTDKELTLEYKEKDVSILERCFNLFVKFNIDIYILNLRHYISLPGFSFDCFL